MSTLVLDCGEHCVGILHVEGGQFRLYNWGPELAEEITLIQAAEEIITYNGKNYDLGKLAEFAKLDRSLPLRGRHIDMRSIRWSDEIWGSSLGRTYREYFSDWPQVDDTYEGSVKADVLMTFKLWELWRAGGMTNAHEQPN